MQVSFLCRQVELAQMALDKAKDELDQAKIELIKEVGLKTEGSTTLSEGAYKVTTTQAINRTVDQKAVANVLAQFNEKSLVAPLAIKYSLDIKHYKGLELANPEMFKIIQKAVTSKPSKPSVKIVRAEQC